MTDEKRYELILKLCHAYDEATDMHTAEMIDKDPDDWAMCTTLPFIGEAAQLLLDAKQGMDKKTTSAGKLAALNRVYKSCPTSRENMRGIFRSGERWAICDGFRFIRVNSKPESIPECAGNFDIDKTIPKNVRENEVVELPSVADIKAAIANLKAKHGKGWKNEPIELLPGWWCNPQYALDMVQIFPVGKAYRPEYPHSPLYYEAEEGDALLLPVRHAA